MSKAEAGRRIPPGSGRGRLLRAAVLLSVFCLLTACGEPSPSPSPDPGPAAALVAPTTAGGGDPNRPGAQPTVPATTPTAPATPGPEAADEPLPDGAESAEGTARQPPQATCSTQVPTPCEFAIRQVEVRSAGGRIVELSVEIADSPELRSRGLMFRSTLGDDEGMLFEFSSETSGGFWMRNTYLGLDIAFLDADGVVLTVLPGEPESLESINPGQPYRYALEVNRGWFASMGFGPGDRVTVGGVPPPEPPLPTPAPTAIPIEPGAAALLNELDVKPEHDAEYDRDDWPHWSDLDRDGCNTRCEVLAAERLPDGSWYSVFDGRSTTVAREFDIDHLVPLAEAHESGGWEWDRSTRQRFANDETYAHSLIAVSASSNRSKGKKDPGEWLPPDAGSHCFYADAWVRVKHRWSLSVDVNELIALGRILTNCPETGPAPEAPTQETTDARPPPDAEPPAVDNAGAPSLASCDAGGELVVITGPAGFELAGWTISDEGRRNEHTFAPGTQIPASGSLVVASGRASGDVKPWGGRNVWNNDGDTATLDGPDAAPVSLPCT